MSSTDSVTTAPDDGQRLGPLDRALRVFGDVRAGEGATVLLMCLNVFLLLTAYYILKTAREPLMLLSGGAELKSYAAAVQALALIACVPLYGWVAQKLPRQRFLVVVILFSWAASSPADRLRSRSRPATASPSC